MSLIVRCVYDITNCVCQAVTHVILRDLTNYYWYSEIAETEHQNKVPSAINEYSSGISKINENYDEPNTCVENHENAELVCDIYKNTKESKTTNINIKTQYLNEVQIEKNNSLESLDIPNTERYGYEDFIEKYNQDNELENLAVLLDGVLSNVVKKNNTSYSCGIFGVETNCDINENNKYKEKEYADKKDLRSYDKQILETDSLFHERLNVIDNQYKETASGDYTQNKNEVDTILNNETVPELNVWDACTGYNPISTDCSEPCSLNRKNSSYEINQNKDHEISFEVFKSDVSEKSYNLPENKFENLNNDKQRSKNPLEIMESNEVYKEQESTCNDDNWVVNLLSDIKPELSTNQEKKIINTDIQCDCLKTHICLQEINFDDQDDLLTDEQLQSVETGSDCK